MSLEDNKYFDRQDARDDRHERVLALAKELREKMTITDFFDALDNEVGQPLGVGQVSENILLDLARFPKDNAQLGEFISSAIARYYREAAEMRIEECGDN
jgi:hypothetical protein